MALFLSECDTNGVRCLLRTDPPSPRRSAFPTGEPFLPLDWLIVGGFPLFGFLHVTLIVFVFTMPCYSHETLRGVEVSPSLSNMATVTASLQFPFLPLLRAFIISGDVRSVPGGFFHRWYLRFLTDAFSPLHLYGDIIWVFNPGIIRTLSLKGNGLNKSRIGGKQGRVMITSRQRCACYYRGHVLESFQSTYQIFLLVRVMWNAFRSLIYMMLAYYKCMKRGLNRFTLLPVRLPFGKQGYFHFFIGIVFNSLYLFHRLYLNGFMYHVNSYD